MSKKQQKMIKYSKFDFETLKFATYNGEEIEYLWIDFLPKK